MINIFWKYITTSGSSKIHLRNECKKIKGIFLPYIIKKTFHWNEEEYSVTTGEHGKPFFSDSPHAAYFNISHSGNIWICALSEKNIGIDLEHISRKRPLLVKGMFSEKEQKMIEDAEISERHPIFFHLWTSKEAFSKMSGDGLSRELLREAVVTGNKIINHNSGKTVAYRHTIPIAEGYMVTVCTESPIKDTDIKITFLAEDSD